MTANSERAPRRIDVFFYGLFMDTELLAGKGITPESPRAAVLPGYSLRIGNRAAVVRDADKRVYGIVVALTHEEIERLYADASVRMYKPEPVLCELSDGDRIPALCFNLVESPAGSDPNPEYAARLKELALRLQLPSHYVDEIAAYAGPPARPA